MINIFETSFEARERRFQIEKLYHGETVDLVGVVTTNGVPQNITGYSVSGVFQPTSMNGSPDFYELSADIVENKVIVHWEKGKDFGENSYMVWALLTDGDNASYPIAWRLDMAYSPSFPLSALDPIPKAIDFSKYELINAPWAMLSDFQDFQEEVSETYATKNEVAEGLAALSDEYEPIGAEERAKEYTDEKASKYLPLSGGTMGGNIIVQPTKYFETRENDGNDGYYSIRYTGTTIDTRGSSLDGILRFPRGSGTLALEENVQQSIDALSDEYVTKVELTASYPTRNQVAQAIDTLSEDYEPIGAEANARRYTDEKVAALSDEYATKEALTAYATKNYVQSEISDFITEDALTGLATKEELTAYAKEDELSDYVKMEDGGVNALTVSNLVATDLTSETIQTNNIYAPGITSDTNMVGIQAGYITTDALTGNDLAINGIITFGDSTTLSSTAGFATKEELTSYAQLSDIPELPDDLVHEDELSDYAKLSDVPEIDLSQMSACLSSAEFADVEELGAAESVSFQDLVDKVNLVIQKLKRTWKDPKYTWVTYLDNTVSAFNLVGSPYLNGSITNIHLAKIIRLGTLVTGIPNYGFSDRNAAVTLEIPSSVVSINSQAFAGASRANATLKFIDRTVAEVQTMSNYRWNMNEGKIICTDGTL